MKSTWIFCNSIENTANIFSLNSVGSRKTGLSLIQLSASTEISFFETEGTSKDPAKTIYDKVRIIEDKIAIGVDAGDV